jgi:hypothetical protein
MGVAAAAGVPQQSGILIPEIWSGKLLAKFYAATVLAQMANTDYEGEISKQGDKVWIRTTPDVAISDYQKGATLSIQHPTPNKISLTIDRAKYWNFVTDDIDKFQSDVAFTEDWTRDASEQLKISWDTLALGTVYASASPFNAGLTAGLISGAINLGVSGTPLTVGNATGNTTPVDFLMRLSQALDEQNVPESDRYAVIPTWLSNRLKLSDLKNAYLTGDDKSTIRNGMIGSIDRMTVYVSNLLPKAGAATIVYGGQKSALTFASQLTNNEAIRAESTFGTLVRGLQVCGWQVVKPEAMAIGVAIPGG